MTNIIPPVSTDRGTSTNSVGIETSQGQRVAMPLVDALRRYFLNGVEQPPAHCIVESING